MGCVRRLAAVAFVVLTAASAHAQPSDSTLENGFAALQRGDADAAARVFRGALADHPRDAALLYGAGYAAYLQGREEDARDLLKRAVDIEPRLLQAAVLLGEIASRTGDLDLAIKTYEHVLSLAEHDLLKLPTGFAPNRLYVLYKAIHGVTSTRAQRQSTCAGG